MFHRSAPTRRKWGEPSAAIAAVAGAVTAVAAAVAAVAAAVTAAIAAVTAAAAAVTAASLGNSGEHQIELLPRDHEHELPKVTFWLWGLPR